MYDKHDDEEEIEIDFHAEEKNRREKRIKGKQQDKKVDKWNDGGHKKLKKQKRSRNQQKDALRDIMKSYL